MYTEHFGLDREVFNDGIAQNESVYCGAAEAPLQANLSVALNRSDSVTVICGPPRDRQDHYFCPYDA
jgi:hypothetical protein